MNKNDCEAAESIADSFLRMARVNCNFLFTGTFSCIGSNFPREKN